MEASNGESHELSSHEEGSKYIHKSYRSGGKNCVACPNYYYKTRGQGISYRVIPKDQSRQEAWFTALKLKCRPKNPQHSFVCSEHFLTGRSMYHFLFFSRAIIKWQPAMKKVLNCQIVREGAVTRVKPTNLAARTVWRVQTISIKPEERGCHITGSQKIVINKTCGLLLSKQSVGQRPHITHTYAVTTLLQVDLHVYMYLYNSHQLKCMESRTGCTNFFFFSIGNA